MTDPRRVPGLSAPRDESLELDWWYDAQIRRYLLQFVRLFSGIRWRADVRGGRHIYRRLPVRMALQSRQVAWLLQRANENAMLTLPMATVRITGLRPSDERRMPPYHHEARRMIERAWDPQTERYTDRRGPAWTVERHMGVPYDLSVDLDIWTTNLDQKLQLFEQIAVLFNPTLDLYSSESYLDWGALAYVRLDDVSWSTSTHPIEVDNIDIMTLSFVLAIWITPPVRVDRQRMIGTIVQNLVDARRLADLGTGWAAGVRYDPSDLLYRHYVTATDRWLRVEGNEVRLLGPNAEETDADGNPWRWDLLLERLPGTWVPGETQLLLLDPSDVDDLDRAVAGTLDDGPDSTVLLWNVDPATLPAPTLSPVEAAIDPHRTWPGNGLPAATAGMRLLLLDEIGPSQAWPGLTASAGDVIEWDGTRWLRVFIADDHPDETHWMDNLASGRRLRWDGRTWTDALDGDHPPGLWRIGFTRPEDFVTG